MSWTKCPKCGYRESDGRPHDRETYYEVCALCAPKLARELAKAPVAVKGAKP